MLTPDDFIGQTDELCRRLERVLDLSCGVDSAGATSMQTVVFTNITLLLDLFLHSACASILLSERYGQPSSMPRTFANLLFAKRASMHEAQRSQRAEAIGSLAKFIHKFRLPDPILLQGLSALVEDEKSAFIRNRLLEAQRTLNTSAASSN